MKDGQGRITVNPDKILSDFQDNLKSLYKSMSQFDHLAADSLFQTVALPQVSQADLEYLHSAVMVEEVIASIKQLKQQLNNFITKSSPL